MDWVIVKKFPLEKDLSSITFYLRERAIEHRIYEEAGEQVVAVNDPRMVAPLAQFIAEIDQGKWAIQAHQEVEQLPPASSQWLQSVKTTPLNLLFIFLSCLGALLVEFDYHINLLHWFTFQDVNFGVSPPQFSSLSPVELWRNLTPAFIHFGLFHVLFNSLWMWDLGRRLELLLGFKGYLLFFVFAAACSNWAQYLWGDGGLFGGMSGVVYALVGFILIHKKLAPHPLTHVPSSVLGFMLIWLVLCMTGVVNYFIDGSVANAAHIGGLVAGVVFAIVTIKLNAARDGRYKK